MRFYRLIADRNDMTDCLKKVIIFTRFWSLSDCENNPDWLFIFGENEQQYESKKKPYSNRAGQAVIRSADNSFGFRTKKRPTRHSSSYWYDSEFARNKALIDEDILKIKHLMKSYTCLVLPEDGLGTGLSDLKNKAPRTLEYINEQFSKLVKSLSNLREIKDQNRKEIIIRNLWFC